MNDYLNTPGRKNNANPIVTLVAIFSFVFCIFPVFLHAEESSCVSCHTSLKNILKEIRAIEASQPKVKKSTESKGEG